MSSPQAGRIYLDFGCHMDVSADITDADVVMVCHPCPVNGVIKSVYICADVLPGAGTFDLQNGSNADVAIVTQEDLTALTANVGHACTLGANINVKSTQMLRAVWTFTTITSGEGFGCIVEIEPTVQ